MYYFIRCCQVLEYRQYFSNNINQQQYKGIQYYIHTFSNYTSPTIEYCIPAQKEFNTQCSILARTVVQVCNGGSGLIHVNTADLKLVAVFT